MFASGICGSQLVDINNKSRSEPAFLGHEGTGQVIKIGKEVKHVNEGDNVLISWMPYGANKNTKYLECKT